MVLATSRPDSQNPRDSEQTNGIIDPSSGLYCDGKTHDRQTDTTEKYLQTSKSTERNARLVAGGDGQANSSIDLEPGRLVG